MKTALMISLIIGILTIGSNQKRTIKIEKGHTGIIGYGSLLSLKRTQEVIKRKYVDSIYRVHLVGYQREWNIKRSFHPKGREQYDGFYVYNGDTLQVRQALTLNITEDKSKEMNCVLYLMTENDLKLVDENELDYEKLDVTRLIKEYDFTGGNVYVYKALPGNIQKRKPVPADHMVIPKFYVERVNKACDSIGPDFRKEFEATTIPFDPKLEHQVIWKLKK